MIYLSIKYLKIRWKSVVFAKAVDRSRDFLLDVPFLTLLNQFPPQSGVCFFAVLRTCMSQILKWALFSATTFINTRSFGLSGRIVRWLFTPQSAPVSNKRGAVVCFGALISTGASVVSNRARSFSTLSCLRIDFNAQLKFATVARSMLAS